MLLRSIRAVVRASRLLIPRSHSWAYAVCGFHPSYPHIWRHAHTFANTSFEDLGLDRRPERGVFDIVGQSARLTTVQGNFAS